VATDLALIPAHCRPRRLNTAHPIARRPPRQVGRCASEGTAACGVPASLRSRLGVARSPFLHFLAVSTQLSLAVRGCPLTFFALFAVIYPPSHALHYLKRACRVVVPRLRGRTRCDWSFVL
jgi:hypothetical protein